jgi:multimeric flavodoxin WrbA
MRRVLVVWHSRTGLARAMADALEEGASLAATGMESELTLVRRAAGEATVEDLLSSDGYLFCAPENLAMVSGEMAEFFQRVYYHVFDTHESSSGYGESSRLLGRPCALGRWQPTHDFRLATATYCHILPRCLPNS